MRLVLLLALTLAACASEPEMAPESPTSEPSSPTVDDSIVGVVDSNPQLSILANALGTAGLTDTLSDSDGVYTLFAPSDAAFASLDEGVRTALLADPERLQSVLSGHALSTRMLSLDVIDGLSIEAMNGAELSMASDGVRVQLRDASGTTATVTTADLDTSNGVVHIIDAVLSL